MKVFIDTNIIIDFFDSRREHYLPAAILFDLAMKGKIELTVCAQSFITAFYVLGKSYPKAELYTSMRSLYRLCGVSPVDSSIISLRAMNVVLKTFPYSMFLLNNSLTNSFNDHIE